MLVLTRKPEKNHDVIRLCDERTGIESEVTITIRRVKGKTVRVGITAPKHYRIVRGELGPKEGE